MPIKLVISKVERTHEAGFRVTEKMHELDYKHTSKDGHIKRISEPFSLILRNKKVVKVGSRINQNHLYLEVYSGEKEILYWSGDVGEFKLVSTFEDGLRYQFVLTN